MVNVYIVTGSFAAFLGVLLGAFGAHGLRGRVSESSMTVWNTGVQYHLTHALGLILVGILIHLYSGSVGLKVAGWLFLTGIILFSGSLYLIAVFEIRKLGIITPFGGLAFLAGWICLTVSMVR